MKNRSSRILTDLVKTNRRSHHNVRAVPESRPIPGREKEMVRNSAGGYVWELDKWTCLDRFLILGVEGGTFHVSEKKHAQRNVTNVLACIKADGVRVVNRILEMVEGNRLPNIVNALFVLGLCMKSKVADLRTKQLANSVVPQICNISTDVFDLVNIIEELGGWGSGTRRAFARWYAQKDPRTLAYQIAKYQQRNGVSHRDVLRLCHAIPVSEKHNELFQYVTGKLPWDMDTYLEGKSSAKEAWFRPIEGLERAKRATSEAEIVELINEFRLTHEMIPSHFKGSRVVDAALLQEMPVMATIRQLGRLTANNTLSPLGDNVRLVVDRITNTEQLLGAKIHPIEVLKAIHTYCQGHGEKGKLHWNPIAQIKDALDEAFYKSFGWIQPTGLRYMLGIDTSGSMTWSTSVIQGMPGVNACMAAATMAMVTAKTERNYLMGGFANDFYELGITAKDTIEQAMRKTQNHQGGGTDCTSVLRHAIAEKIPVDVFVIYTDNDTWAGRDGHASQLLKTYRQKVNPNAKFISVAMIASKHSLADPRDRGMLDLVGFDTATPQIITEFALGNM